MEKYKKVDVFHPSHFESFDELACHLKGSKFKFLYSTFKKNWNLRYFPDQKKGLIIGKKHNPITCLYFEFKDDENIYLSINSNSFYSAYTYKQAYAVMNKVGSVNKLYH